jgi:hypothetical protein
MVLEAKTFVEVNENISEGFDEKYNEFLAFFDDHTLLASSHTTTTI